MQQVVARTHHVGGHPNGRLPITTSLRTADPGHSIVAVMGLGIFHRGHCIAAGLLQVALHFLVLGQCTPAGLTYFVRHLFGHGLTGQLGTVEVDTTLHHSVAEQLIESWIGALDDQRRQRHHRLGRVLHDATHDLLKTFGDAVQLVLQGVGEAHVSAHHVRSPRTTDTETTGSIERTR
eukprot:gene12553-biopygen5222